MIINISDIWKDSEKTHNQYIQSKIEEYEFSNEFLHKTVKKFIEENIESITSTGEIDLISSIENYRNTFNQIEDDANIIFSNIFNYDYFCKPKKTIWCAQKLCESVKYKLCPYCQITPILSTNESIIEPNKIKAHRTSRPTIDHYYDKASFPFLALTLGNFIPSCHLCNCTYKNTRSFFENPHLNPLRDPEKIQFKLILKDNEDVSSIRPYKIIAMPDNEGCLKTENSLKTFDITVRYESLEDIANGSYHTLMNSLDGRQKSVDSILDFKVDYFKKVGIDLEDNSEYKQYIAGKMRRDIYLKYFSK